MANWNRAHRMDRSAVAGTAYGQTTGLLPGITDTYLAVMSSGGRVYSYELNLPSGTDLAAAEARFRRDMPPARAVWSHTYHACLDMQLASKALVKPLGDHGWVNVAFYTNRPDGSSAPFTSSNVNSVLVSNGGSATPAGFSGC